MADNENKIFYKKRLNFGMFKTQLDEFTKIKITENFNNYLTNNLGTEISTTVLDFISTTNSLKNPNWSNKIYNGKKYYSYFSGSTITFSFGDNVEISIDNTSPTYTLPNTTYINDLPGYNTYASTLKNTYASTTTFTPAYTILQKNNYFGIIFDSGFTGSFTIITQPTDITYGLCIIGGGGTGVMSTTRSIDNYTNYNTIIGTAGGGGGGIIYTNNIKNIGVNINENITYNIKVGLSNVYSSFDYVLNNIFTNLQSQCGETPVITIDENNDVTIEQGLGGGTNLSFAYSKYGYSGGDGAGYNSKISTLFKTTTTGTTTTTSTLQFTGNDSGKPTLQIPCISINNGLIYAGGGGGAGTAGVLTIIDGTVDTNIPYIPYALAATGGNGYSGVSTTISNLVENTNSKNDWIYPFGGFFGGGGGGGGNYSLQNYNLPNYDDYYSNAITINHEGGGVL